MRDSGSRSRSTDRGCGQPGAQVSEDLDDRPDPWRPCRTDHIRSKTRGLVRRTPAAPAPLASSLAKKCGLARFPGAVGTHAHVPPDVEDEVCEALDLRPAPASTQIIQRDRHAFFLSVLAGIGATIEKFAVEVRHLQRTEVREVEEPFGEGNQGSSAMPHKRNPHESERLSGLARLLRGYALTGLENVAFWHERDISHSSTERVIFPDACIVLDFMLDEMSELLENLVVYEDRMLQNLNLTGGLVFSQRVLLGLVDGGVDRQVAYKLVQKHALDSWDERIQSFGEAVRNGYGNRQSGQPGADH